MKEILASPDIAHDDIKFVKALAAPNVTIPRKWSSYQTWLHTAPAMNGCASPPPGKKSPTRDGKTEGAAHGPLSKHSHSVSTGRELRAQFRWTHESLHGGETSEITGVTGEST